MVRLRTSPTRPFSQRFLSRAGCHPGRTDHNTTDTQGSAAQLKTEGRKTTTSDRGRVMGRDEMRHGCRACDPRTERRSNAALPTASSNLRRPGPRSTAAQTAAVVRLRRGGTGRTAHRFSNIVTHFHSATSRGAPRPSLALALPLVPSLRLPLRFCRARIPRLASPRPFPLSLYRPCLGCMIPTLLLHRAPAPVC